jgi:hypothetical protein
MLPLIFRRPMNSQEPIPYGVWLREVASSIVLFTMRHEVDDHCFAHVERFDSFDSHGLTEIRAIELHERFPFTHIFVQSEHDILRAAQLREWFGLEGQSVDSARAYRDKIYMKTLAQAGGVEMPCFRALTTSLDLYAFANQQGFPCVVKPRTGAGSRGVRVLWSIDDLKSFLKKPLPVNYMVETYVDGTTYHVDGLVTEGRMLFSSVARYFRGCLSFQKGENSGCVLLDPTEELSTRLVNKTKEVIACLPSPSQLAIHAEFFIDTSDQLLFGEIACRPGGSRTVDPIEIAFGFNMYQQWVRRSMGLPIQFPEPREWHAVGRFLVLPHRGRLLSLPTAAPFEWVIDYRSNSAPGQYWEAPEFGQANVASFIISGNTTEQVESRMKILDNWCKDEFHWEEC